LTSGHCESIDGQAEEISNRLNPANVRESKGLAVAEAKGMFAAYRRPNANRLRVNGYKNQAWLRRKPRLFAAQLQF